MGVATGKAELLSRLRETVSKLEGRGATLDESESAQADGPKAWSFGIPALDEHLGGGLAPDGLHEWGAAAMGHGAALVSVAVGLLQRLPVRGRGGQGAHGAQGDGILWVMSAMAAAEYGRPYGPGLVQAGADPRNVLFVVGKRETDVAWAAEEGLKAGGALKAVVGVGQPLSFAASRRLNLAATEAGVPCLWLSPGGQLEGSSAALTRWRVASAASLPDAHAPRAPGRAVWDLELLRARSAPPVRFKVVWDDETGGFALAAALADGAAAAGAASARRRKPGGGASRAA